MAGSRFGPTETPSGFSSGHTVDARAARNTILLDQGAALAPAFLAYLLGIHVRTAVRWVRNAGRDWAGHVEGRDVAIVVDVLAGDGGNNPAASVLRASSPTQGTRPRGRRPRLRDRPSTASHEGRGAGGGATWSGTRVLGRVPIPVRGFARSSRPPAVP